MAVTATTQAVLPPAFAAAPPVQQKTADDTGHAGAALPLLTSLSGVPAVQRACAACGDEDSLRRMPIGAVQAPEEGEADEIADRVMARRSGVQRRCDGCEAEETPVMPRLDVGPVDDPFEREADAIAGQVMAMRTPDKVQRKCAACTAEDEEMPVRPRRAAPLVQRSPAALLDDDPLQDMSDVPRMRPASGAGPEQIAASASQLTGGGTALSDDTRSFFESRMGRDLSDVRIHRGGVSHALNDSISARAFTYRNHIWLSASEPETPSFTMAHELAHVLQQTQPGAVQPKVRRASRRLDEKIYFAPGDTREEMTPFHDRAVGHATNRNGLLGHVAVPNANGTRSYVGEFKRRGYADLVKSDKPILIGSMAEEVDAPPAQRPWYMPSDPATGLYHRPTNINLYPKNVSHHYREGAGIDAGTANGRFYRNESAPRWRTRDETFFRDVTQAPTSYKIADMKFMGGKDKAGDAREGVTNYKSGFTFFHAFYDRAKQRGNAMRANPAMANLAPADVLPDWSFTASDMPALGDESSVRDAGPVAKLWAYRMPGGGGRFQRMTFDPKPGKLFYRQNPDKPYLWEYYFWPTSATEQTKGKDAGTVTKGTKAGVILLDKARKSPTGSKVDTSPTPRPRRLAATPAKPVVAPKKGRKPPPKKDPFVAGFAKWKRDQEAFTKSFAAFSDPKSGKGKAALEKLAFDTAMQNTIDELGGKSPDGTGAPPKLNEKRLKTARTQVNTAYIMAGKSGAIIGQMRKTFGAAFVKALNIYERLKTKFNEFMEKGRQQRGAGAKPLVKAMLKVTGAIFGAVFRFLLPEIAAHLVDCVEEGFKGMFKTMLETDFTEMAEEEIDKKIAEFQQLEADLEAKIEEAAEALKERFAHIYESVMAAWESTKKLIEVAKLVFNAVRAAACVAGGLETIGISCVIAGIDFLSSELGGPSSEDLFAHLMGSCVAQEMVAKFILGSALIQNLPSAIAEAIRANVKEKLPPELSGLICDKIASVPSLPDPKDIPCIDTDDPRGGGTGTNHLEKPDSSHLDEINKEATEDQKAKTGIFDIPDSAARRILREALSDDLLQPEDPLPEGTPNVWDEPGAADPTGDLPSVEDLPPPIVPPAAGQGKLPSVTDLPPSAGEAAAKEDKPKSGAGKKDDAAPQGAGQEAAPETEEETPAGVAGDETDADEESLSRGTGGKQSIRDGGLDKVTETVLTRTDVSPVGNMKFAVGDYPKTEVFSVAVTCIEMVEGGLTYGPHVIEVDHVSVQESEEHGLLITFEIANEDGIKTMKNGDSSIALGPGAKTGLLKQ